MFLAIREWWRQRGERGSDRVPGRKRRIAKLFLFEFVIVVMGVLVAQLLGQAIADSRERADARGALGLAKAQGEVLLALAQVSEDTTPCLRRRADALLAAAQSGATVDVGDLRGPLLPSVEVTPWSDRMIGAVQARFGGIAVGTHANLLSQSESLANANDDIGEAWSRFEILAPEYGPRSASERERLRQASIDLRRAIRSRQLVVESIRRNVEDWALEPNAVYFDNYYALADNCGFPDDG